MTSEARRRRRSFFLYAIAKTKPLHIGLYRVTYRSFQMPKIMEVYEVYRLASFFSPYWGVPNTHRSDSDGSCVRGQPLNNTTLPRSNGAAAFRDCRETSVGVCIYPTSFYRCLFGTIRSARVISVSSLPRRCLSAPPEKHKKNGEATPPSTNY